jgi:hypothetical protein
MDEEEQDDPLETFLKHYLLHVKLTPRNNSPPAPFHPSGRCYEVMLTRVYSYHGPSGMGYNTTSLFCGHEDLLFDFWASRAMVDAGLVPTISDVLIYVTETLQYSKHNGYTVRRIMNELCMDKGDARRLRKFATKLWNFFDANKALEDLQRLFLPSVY